MRSSQMRDGWRVSAEQYALPGAAVAEIGTAPSMRSKASRMPASSTIATETFHLFFSASAMEAASIFLTSADVRHGLLRMEAPHGLDEGRGGRRTGAI